MHGISKIGILTSAILLWTTEAEAVCEEALVQSTFSRVDQSESNWQLAQFIDEATYNMRKSSAGGSATIYGIPMSGNYAQFRQNVTTRLNMTNSRWSTSQAHNVLWTGLDPNATTGYLACLNSQVFNQPGLHAAVVGASETNIAIKVRWNVPGNVQRARVAWTVPVVGGFTLPVDLPQGDTMIQIPRPDRSVLLAANYEGYASSAIMLEPLPQAEPAGPTLVEKIRAGRPFVLIVDPNASALPPFTWYSAERTGSLSRGQIVTGRYYRREGVWSSNYAGVSGVWCYEETCTPPEPFCYPRGPQIPPCQNERAGLTSRRLSPDNLELGVMGIELTFNEVGHVFYMGSPIGFVTVPDFASNESH